MALSKEEVRNAFREVALREYADVPPAEEIDHVFSERFLSSMAALIEEEKRGSWRLLSQQRRRALVVAAILAAAVLLTACTPALREAVTEFVVSVYERFVDYGTKTELHDELDTIYVLDPVPEGFEFVSQTQYSTYYVETIYQDKNENLLVLSQATSENLGGTIDTEQGEMLVVGENNLSIFMYSSDELTLVSWIFDGYYMKLSFYGQIHNDQIISILTTISPQE